eukprot:370736-Rhodomonas_salina.2
MDTGMRADQCLANALPLGQIDLNNLPVVGAQHIDSPTPPCQFQHAKKHWRRRIANSPGHCRVRAWRMTGREDP